jgi:hypothetical protein
MRIAMTLLALALSATACKKKENTAAETTTGSAVGSDMAGSAVATPDAATDMAATPDAGAGSAAGDASTMTKKAGNCPSTVAGAVTKASVKGKDVLVSITSKDKDAIASIQQRTEVLLKERTDEANKQADPGAAHDRRGTHQGRVGLCPVHIPEGATAKAKNDKNGVTVTITPKDNLEGLKSEIDVRITKAETWVKENIKAGDQGTQGGVGGGKGDHGGNHSGQGDSKGVERKKTEGGTGGGKDTGGGGGKGTGGGGSKGTGGGSGAGSATK